MKLSSPTLFLCLTTVFVARPSQATADAGLIGVPSGLVLIGQASSSEASAQKPTPANFKVEPDSLKAGTSADLQLSGDGVNDLLAQLSDLRNAEVYLKSGAAQSQKVSTVTVGPPTKKGTAGTIRLGLTVSADAIAGSYELYVSGKPTGAVFTITAPNAKTAPATPEQIRVEPLMSPPGQVVNLKITGGKIPETLQKATKDQLHFYWQIPPGKHTDFNVALAVTDFLYSVQSPTSPEYSLTVQVSIAPDALPGTYQLYLDPQNGGAGKDKTAFDVLFSVGAAALGEYTYCPLTPLQGNGTDLLCSQSLLTYKEEREVFGKAVADQYVAVEVRIQNRNTQFPFLLADVRLGTSNSELTTSRDRTFVRTFAEKGEAYSVRAIALRSLAAAGTILGGIGPAVGNMSLSNAIQILVGPTTSAANSLFPDRSSHEIEVISDYGFSVVQTLVIPSRSPARIYCFIPQRQILSQPYNKISDDTSKWSTVGEFQALQKNGG
jgi:hypothetical protein